MNRFKFKFNIMVLWIVFSLCANSCSAPARLVSVTPRGEPAPVTGLPNPTASFTPFQPATDTSTPLPTSTATLPPTWTQTPTPTQTPSPTPTATWIFNEAGKVVAPILLYHHVADITPSSRYYVSPDKFRAQMQALHDWGCTTITPSYLRQVLVNGGDLPYRPVVITFDDGNIDVYDNAFPIMREFGFVGTFYIVTNRLKSEGYVGVDQLKKMVRNGWEIGSHSRTHMDLTLNYDYARDEMLQSRLDLQEALSVTVTSFAYPYGLVDAYIATQAQEYGYFTGMGLGILTEHTLGSLFYLNRREVGGEIDLTTFAALFPWSLTVITHNPPDKHPATPVPAATGNLTPTPGNGSP